MFYLGECIESPIYRGGELQSRCNGTPSSGGYERAKRRWGSFEPVLFALCTLFAGKRGTASKIAKHSIWALDYIGPK